MTDWNKELPNVSEWQPRLHRTASLSIGLLLSCQAAQARIISQSETEISFNIDNFDSGLGIEDLVREELTKLLPDRYSTDPGVVNDRDGLTSGDHEILIRNRIWAPVTKLGATPTSRRFHYPIESIYSAIEVKQTLGFHHLDDAMKKLVKVSRLNRPANPYGHITENQHLMAYDKDGHILNPLHTAIIGVRLQPNVSFRDLALRFGAINARLSRDDMVNVLCVLGYGIASYERKTGEATYVDADFMRDRNEYLYLSVDENEPDSVFYRFYVDLAGHLNRSVLGVHNIVGAYGTSERHFQVLPFENALYNQGVR